MANTAHICVCGHQQQEQQQRSCQIGRTSETLILLFMQLIRGHFGCLYPVINSIYL